MSVLSPPKCPRCAAQLVLIKTWFGLRGTFPTSCAQCGTRLVYDTLGGVCVRPESKS
ncbi:MAG: hypothetical protein H0T42_11565 [Deltaproteobacteria bacterium]|nr:hypothetical protein [Deltaproteobacteria bacterium]